MANVISTQFIQLQHRSYSFLRPCNMHCTSHHTVISLGHTK